MKRFGWKRKVGENVNKTKVIVFCAESKDENEDAKQSEVDWLTSVPKRQCISLEDTFSKSERLKQEGGVLAEAERYWEAIKKWDEALQLTQNNEQILEMKAQTIDDVNDILVEISDRPIV
ncbi:Tetratricopeptide repeat protein 33 [Bulinus truncatus]|nr:Tetratricopeptide repeat protein 33 [Bulinus truncatus]